MRLINRFLKKRGAKKVMAHCTIEGCGQEFPADQMAEHISSHNVDGEIEHFKSCGCPNGGCQCQH